MPTVLLVDDDADLRGILELAITGIPDVDVRSVSSAEAALALALNEPVHFVVTDFRMDGMNGVDLLVKLRENRVWPSFGALVISGDDDERLLQRVQEAGGMDLWRKPVSAARLRRFVSKLIGG